MTLTILPRSKFTNEISGWQGGNGPPLVLIHGVGLRAEAWRAMLPALIPHFSVTLLDLPGHGESAAFDPESNPGLADYTNRIAEVLEGLERRPMVIGHSLGALICLDLAIERPELLTGIVPLNAIYRRSQNAAKVVRERAVSLPIDAAANPDLTLARWFGDAPTGSLKMMSDECRNWLANGDPTGYRQAYMVFAHEDGPSDESLRKLNCTVLFITGEKEPNSTPAMSRLMADLVPEGECLIVRDALHMMPMTHAEVVSKAVTRFHQRVG